MTGFDLQLFADEPGAPAAQDSDAQPAQQEPGAPAAQGKTQEGNKQEGTPQGVLSGAQSQQGGVLSDAKQEDAPQQEQGGAPEKYEAFTLPDGVAVDEPALKDFTALARELNLTQANAQRLVDFQMQFQAATAARRQQEIDAATQAENERWKEETLKAFKQEEIQDAVRGFRSAPKEVQRILAAGGYENHKAFVEFFRDIGRAIKEDKFETGKAGQKEKSAANVLYPELN